MNIHILLVAAKFQKKSIRKCFQEANSFIRRCLSISKYLPGKFRYVTVNKHDNNSHSWRHKKTTANLYSLKRKIWNVNEWITALLKRYQPNVFFQTKLKRMVKAFFANHKIRFHSFLAIIFVCLFYAIFFLLHYKN